MTDAELTRSQAYEESENLGRNTSDNPSMGEIIAQRFSRRDLMRGALAVTAISATVSPLALTTAEKARAETDASAFRFKEPAAGVDERHHVAEGYDADILIRWGDPVLPGASAFDPKSQSAEAQAGQFGYNNDFLGYIPLPDAADPSAHGLLVVNHEYTNEELMFPGIPPQHTKDVRFKDMTKALVDIEMMAHGGSVIEVRKVDGKWQVVPDSKYARRITAETEMEITGPAAGAERMKTSYDAEGRKVRGMLNNCAGGITPWGTWLTCEENFNGYFWGKADGHPEEAALKRYGVPGNSYNWGQHYDRFDLAKEPNESNRFGWVVEIDPLDPTSVPKKRTAMGRFKHEGAANIVNKDGRFVVYQGDDERFDYVYKFVTEGRVDPADRAANMDLLDRGTLHVARYDADGTGEWLPLVFGEGPLTAANGFASQADVVIEARRAADLLGATKMDRPEDVEANPQTDKVYVILTNNTSRKTEQVDAANPRANNEFGHIIEMLPEGGDHAARKFTWEILVKCGDPSIADVGATFSSATSKDGWFGMPDNCAIDSEGRLWVSTDGMSEKSTGRADGLFAVDTEGAARGTSKLFFRCPAGAELCGPMPTPDLTTFFVAVQHPGDDGKDWSAFGRISTFDDPATRWPDFEDGMPPRPSIVAITKQGGGKIAG
ncbi:dTDP-glucose 4,6-dehydratase [Chelatococcus sp. CO-6]|uniref:PhoX family protein n=1 Tax=Chelatococcus sp. CO-6 TaxID=1702325 RepID=UPI00069E1285|nr:PhoX family phosphatase [Chelatococcus sp. CO-6]ALA18869.1 dTDP-glucose 4,6-dehydratase [Chelatococcus sp. CO-6]